MAARVAVALMAMLLAPQSAEAAFGYTTSTSAYTIDTGAGLVFKIRREDGGSTTSVGDIMSLVYDGVEYQRSDKGSQINSGFDWLYTDISAVSLSIGTVNGNIKVTVVGGSLTHYYIVRPNVNYIYMATHTSGNTNTGLLRYILRLRSDKLPNSPVPSDISVSGQVDLETSDIKKLPNGQSRSKHYSNGRLKDWMYHGATGTDVGMFIVRDNGEGMAGGPFYRCIQNQKTSDTQEITYVFSYGMSQTESFRAGTLNTYTLVVTGGGTPGTVDNSFLSGMGLVGYVSTRGRVTGNGLSGRDTNFEYTVGFANSVAQYFATPWGNNAQWNSPNMIPGTYKMTIYKNELEVQTGEVEVLAQTKILNTITITQDPSVATPIWRIGDWDGSPEELLNGDKLTYMHPSDIRMSNWKAPAYVVGTSGPRDMPPYIWQDVNSGSTEIRFKLSKALMRRSHVLRFGITHSYAGARPRPVVNSWWGAIRAAPSQPKTRSLTVGTYRGNNYRYDFTVPQSAWKTDPDVENVLIMHAVSGSSGSGYLSPAFSIDCIDLVCSNCDVSEGTFSIVARQSELVAGVASGSTQNTANVEQQTNTGADSQRWTIASVGSGYYSIINVNSGLALEVTGGSADNGANIVQYSYWSGAAQQWAIEHVGDGYFSIINRSSGKGLDVAAFSTAAGGNIQQYDYVSGVNQQWYFE
ncbi:putative rhamnogalacturonate lyase A [Diplonema papillatum]|nr:putative rhamnogalacturonate lyase A [Diplonema papillatum]